MLKLRPLSFTREYTNEAMNKNKCCYKTHCCWEKWSKPLGLTDTHLKADVK